MGNRDILLVERFDRRRSENSVQRIPFVSAMTLTGAARPESPANYADIATGMRRDFYAAAATQQDLRELYRRMVYNAMCNNSDDHLRNHGFLLLSAPNGRSGWSLSPAYDVVPQPVMDDSPRVLHLGIGPEGRRATISNLLAAGRHFGLQPAEAQAHVDEIKGIIRQNWEDVFLAAGVPQRSMQDLQNCFALAL